MELLNKIETMRRIFAVETIKDLMSRRAMYSSYELRDRELRELWVSEPEHQKTATFGRNSGYYVGMEAICAYYVDRHSARLEAGCMEVHPVSTPYVVLAEDGISAKGVWYSIGQETYPDENGKLKAMWVNDKIGADFLLEEGGWKIWRLLIANDIWHPAGVSLEDIPVRIPDEEDYVLREFGTPTVPMRVHDPLYLWCDDYPGIPAFYETMTLENSFGPEGRLTKRMGWEK